MKERRNETMFETMTRREDEDDEVEMIQWKLGTTFDTVSNHTQEGRGFERRPPGRMNWEKG